MIKGRQFRCVKW